MLIMPCSFCILKTSRPALPADNVHTLQLPVAGCSIPEGKICKMYGWGETKGTDFRYSCWFYSGLQYIAFYCISLAAVLEYSVYSAEVNKYIVTQSSLKYLVTASIA